MLDYKFELLRTIHTGIVAVAEWYNFQIPTLEVLAGSKVVALHPVHDLALPFPVP